MKFSQLEQITKFFQNFKQISAIYRVNDTTLKIVFDKDYEVYFDMKRSNSIVYKASNVERTKIYQAPFDVVLTKRVNRSDILSISLHNDDKIVRINTLQNSSYKHLKTILQLEFTGKHTNIIILDENETILEALRHVDSESSFRVIRPNIKLIDPPKPTFTPKFYPIENIEKFLEDSYNTLQEKTLDHLKKQKIKPLQKRLQNFIDLKKSLKDEKSLEDEIVNLQNSGYLLLANLHVVNLHDKEITLDSFNQEKVTIQIPQNVHSKNDIPNDFFRRSKKLSNKLKHLHIERDSLQEKINHLKFFIQTVQEAKSINDIQILFPTTKKEKKREIDSNIEIFWLDGYKILIGKNQSGNAKLLKQARARDIWFHLKDRPSAHVIVVTDKKSVPDNVLKTAAKLCVDFSIFEKGSYLVDYTNRREVSVQEGSNVLYTKYNTLQIVKG